MTIKFATEFPGSGFPRWIENLFHWKSRRLAKLIYARSHDAHDAMMKAPKFWGQGWLPSPAFDYRQAWDLVLHYGLILKCTGQISEEQHQALWYAWYPDERWAGEPQWRPAGHAQGLTLCEAVTRCLTDCALQGLLGHEKDGPDR